MADFFQNSYRPLEQWVEHAHRVSFDWPLLTLSNRCLKLFGQWRPCFLRYANILIAFVPLWTEILYTKFQVNRPTVSRYSFPNLIAPPSGKSGQFFLFDQKQCHTHVSWVWWRYLIPFKSYSCLSKLAPPLSTFLRPFANVSWNFNFFSIIIDIHLPENISAWFGSDRAKNLGLVRKSRFWNKFQMAEKLSRRKWNRR